MVVGVRYKKNIPRDMATAACNLPTLGMKDVFAVHGFCTRADSNALRSARSVFLVFILCSARIKPLQLLLPVGPPISPPPPHPHTMRSLLQVLLVVISIGLASAVLQYGDITQDYTYDQPLSNYEVSIIQGQPAGIFGSLCLCDTCDIGQIFTTVDSPDVLHQNGTIINHFADNTTLDAVTACMATSGFSDQFNGVFYELLAGRFSGTFTLSPLVQFFP